MFSSSKLPYLITLALYAGLPSRAVAQIIPDGTLGPESSLLIDVSAVEQLIQGGALREENLFHSFEQFSIGEGGHVYFAHPANVERIFSRVTGDLPSDIFGTLGVNGGADLYLLNPNGIVFGPNARLDVGGSFVVSTANSFAFADGSEFSAVAPETSLLTIDVPLGVQFNTPTQGNIDSFGQLAAGQDLTLQGQELYLEGGLSAGRNLNLQAQETITIRDTAAVPLVARSGGDLTIQGNQGIDIWTLQHLEQAPFVSGGNLTLISDGVISGDAHFESGGNLQFLTLAGAPGNLVSFYDPIISANGDVVFGDYTGVALKVEATGSIAAGDIVITGPDTTLVADGSGSDEDLLASSRAAILRAGVALENGANVPQVVNGTTFANGVLAEQPPGSIVVSSINTSDTTGGAGGPIILEAQGNVVTTGSFETPDGYNSIALGSFSSSESGNSSDGGAISVFALGDVVIGGLDSSSESRSNSGISESGNGGEISLFSSGDITIGGQLSSDSFSRSNSAGLGGSQSGDGGAIALSAVSDITIEGWLRSESVSSSSFGTSESGNGGAISISTSGDVTAGSLRSYSVSFADTSVSGNGGAIAISTLGDIAIGDPISLSSSLSTVGTSVSGDGGTISLSTSGDLSIEGSLQAFSESDASSSTDFSESGNGGAVEISVAGSVLVEGNVETYSSSLSGGMGSSTSGDGGAVEISAFGDVTVIDDQVLGTEYSSGEIRSGSTSQAKTGFSESGNGGQIRISTSGNILIEDDLDSSSFSNSFSSSSLSSTESGDGGSVFLFSSNGDILLSPFLLFEESLEEVSTYSYSSSGPAGSAGSISFRAPAGSVVGNGIELLAFAVTEFDRETGMGGGIYLEAASAISGLEIFTLSNGGNSGNVEIQGNSDRITIESLSLITSGQVEIPGPFGGDSVTTINTDNVGQSGNTRIQNIGDIILSNVNIEASANGSQPAGGVTITSPSQVTFTNSQISSNANSTGDAGTIRLDVGQLNLGNGGRIFAATSGSGNGGSVVVNATDSVFLGEGVQDFEPVISVEASGAGRPGSIIINTPTFVLSETARITATATETATNLEGGGSISLNADQMDLAGIVGIFAETAGQAPGGTLTLQPYRPNPDSTQTNPDLTVTLVEGAVVSASTSGTGPGGGLRILAPESITITGPGRLVVETRDAGNGGDIEVRTRQLTLTDGVELSASTFADAPIPVLETITVETLELVDVSPLFTEMEDAGQTPNTAHIASDQPGIPLTGIVGSLSAEGDVDLYQIYLAGEGTFSASTVDGTSLDTQLFLFSAPDGLGVYGNDDDANCAGCFQSTLPTGNELTPATAGVYYLAVSGFNDTPLNELGEAIFPSGFDPDIGFDAITAPREPGENAALASWTGFGSAVGDYTIQLTGVEQNSAPVEVITTEVTTTTFLEPGDAGDINVVADSFDLTNGATLQTNTSGIGDAGDIVMNVSESLVIDNSAVTSSTLTNSTGAGGNITVNAPLTTLDNGSIAVNSQGTGSGGQVAVTGDQLILLDGSDISATTLSSDGGNLSFDLQEALILRDGSEISTEAGTQGAGGDGGDITINTQFLIAVPNENSDIVANAFDGDGGNVDITVTGGIFGIEPRLERTGLSDITASSRNGVSGTIAVDSPDIDPNQSATELPTTLDAPDVSQSCREAFVQTGSEFVVTGRGGIPQGPLDSPVAPLWQDVLPIEGNEQAGGASTASEPGPETATDSVSIAEPIVEVQGWIKNELGQIVLVAEDPQQAAVGQPLACQS
ncbi:MAG: filamentous hemagglutinin N-terminal domain-containing protein [Leptolyngbyaceae cyanobacterium]